MLINKEDQIKEKTITDIPDYNKKDKNISQAINGIIINFLAKLKKFKHIYIQKDIFIAFMLDTKKENQISLLNCSQENFML
jgi:hypothetical protein